jgi:hypothetical protein
LPPEDSIEAPSPVRAAPFGATTSQPVNDFPLQVTVTL